MQFASALPTQKLRCYTNAWRSLNTEFNAQVFDSFRRRDSLRTRAPAPAPAPLPALPSSSHQED